ncbi:hypothetical protein [Naasia sp.]|nr:hypothetical protein [Naasia sp.]
MRALGGSRDRLELELLGSARPTAAAARAFGAALARTRGAGAEG